MPPPTNKPSLWPFVKALFFNKETALGYIGRNRLVFLLFLTDAILLTMLGFHSEQLSIQKARADSISQQFELYKIKAGICPVTNSATNECRDQLSSAQENYRVVARAYNDLVDRNRRYPTPAPTIPKKQPDPVIPPRSHTDESQEIKRMLDSIR